ncbi:Ig-like domain-containing protein [Microbacterium sp. 3J1]|uniref:Ig-like domain-containing protein n=1 Tax=Microbacterium sp. 3J1 TaxID=861269 RepID=UPI000A4ED37E|nr:Ig-like domain-containing protein [Microbacterium sp. 3J1]
MTVDLYLVRARAHAAKKTTAVTRLVRQGRAALAAVIGLLAVVVGVWGATSPAAAAPTVTYAGAISGVALESSGGGPLGQGGNVRISGSWSVPAGAVSGETFGMTLPVEFTREGAGGFDIADAETGTVMATCVVSAGAGPDVVCTLTDAVSGLEEVGGTFWMQANASSVTKSETVIFDLGETVEIVDLPGDGGIIPADLVEDGAPYKYGGATTADGRLVWGVGVPSKYVADGSLEISDSLDPGLAAHHYTGELKLNQRPVVDGMLTGEWTAVDPALYQVVFASDGQSFEFAAAGLPAGGFAYELIYYTQADGDVLAGDVFGNKAVVETVKTSATYTITDSGGGDGSGVAYTRFSIVKALTGAQAPAARDAVYTVEYTIEGSDAPATRVTVPVGEPVLSTRAPLGTTFVIEEVDLPVIDGITWGDWTISGEGVTAVGDGTFAVTPGSAAAVALTLMNTANPTPATTTPPLTPSATPTPTPTVTPTSSTPRPTPTPAAAARELALTGGSGAAPFMALAGGLILGGSALASVAAVRRRAASRTW